MCDILFYFLFSLTLLGAIIHYLLGRHDYGLDAPGETTGADGAAKYGRRVPLSSLLVVFENWAGNS